MKKIGKKLYVSLKTKSTKEVEECLQPQTLIDMMQKVTKEIRSKLRDTLLTLQVLLIMNYHFLSELMVFLNLLLFGNSCDKFGFSLPVKAIAQIILYNAKSWVRSNSVSTQINGTIRRENHHFYYVLA